MDFENIEFENDFILETYSGTVDLFEQMMEAIFHSSGEKDFGRILEGLKNCYSKIEFLISLETEDSSTATCVLSLLQHQLNTLMETVKTLLSHYTESWKGVCNNLDEDMHRHQLQNSKKQKTCENEITRIITDTIETPKVSGLSEIVGLQDVKKTLRSLVILPKTQPQLFYDRHICNTILLFGPPGTGKTRLVHALAAESDAKFYTISASDVLSPYVGQTEKYSLWIKTEVMCQMSSVEGCTNSFIICATNCPWDLDPAILRRFQKRIYVPLPNKYERFEFFQYFQKDLESAENLEDWTPLLNKTAGYSGSDLADVVQTALNIPLTELESTMAWRCHEEGFYEPISEDQVFSNNVTLTYSDLSNLPDNSVRARRVRMSDFLKAADNVMCTVSPEDVKKYELFVGKQ